MIVSLQRSQGRRLAVTVASRTACLLAALGLAACGVKIDMATVSKSVSEGLKSQLALDIASVSCPPGVRDAKAGDTFECVATPKDGGKITVKVTQKDDKGNVAWEVSKSEGLLNLETVEQAITDGMKEQMGAEAKVSCGGGKLRGSKPGDTFDCTATTEEGTTNIVVTVKDAQGNISWATK